jgi:hypothetical protein
LAYPRSVVSQDTISEKWTNRIQLDVSADDIIKNQVSSYMMREFRALQDVRVVDTKPDIHVSVVAMKVTVGDAYALSVVVTHPLDPDGFKELYSAHVDPKALKSLQGFAKATEVFAGHFVFAGPRTDLQNLCKAVVTELDTKYFEPARKAWQEIQDSIGSHPPERK